MPLNNAATFNQWGRCDRCGFDHPLHMLVRQNGILVCTDGHGCFDNTDVQERERIIQEKLSEEGSQRDEERLDEEEVYFG